MAGIIGLYIITWFINLDALIGNDFPKAETVSNFNSNLFEVDSMNPPFFSEIETKIICIV